METLSARRAISKMDTTDVLIVTQFFPPESMGGAHRWEKISHNLDDDVKPHVLTTFPTFPFGEFDRRWRPIECERVDGVPVTRLFTYQPMGDTTIGRILNYGIFSLLSSLYVLCTFWRYDCIVTMSTPHTTFLPGLIGKLTGRNWVIDIFDLWIDNAADLGYIDRNSLIYRAVSWLERLSFISADSVTVITDTMAEYYEEKYPGIQFNIHVVPFGVDTQMFSPDVEPADSADVIYAGNLGTGQAFIPFLRGFAAVDGDPELLLVGKGERESELKKLVVKLDIEERVTFRGYVDREEIPGLIAGANISIVPLKTKHQLDYARPTKILETMAVGTPYVASAVAEIVELTQVHETGVTVENEAKAIKHALDSLLLDESNSERFSTNGIELIQSQHNWSDIGSHVSSILS